MTRDEELLDEVVRGDAAGYVRLYGFSPPCLSIGRLQERDDIDDDACRRDGIDVVRRPSGGRAVLHDAEVTYAVVCRTDDASFGGNVLASCRRIHTTISAGLRRLGVDAIPHARAENEREAAKQRMDTADCFARPASDELLDVQRHKLVGSAQVRRGPALLQHGSVLLEPSRIAQYLRTTSAPVEGTVGIRGLVGRDVTFDELQHVLCNAFTDRCHADAQCE